MTVKSRVTGLNELGLALTNMPANLAKNVMRKAVRQGANMIADRARENFSGAIEALGGSRSDTLNPHELSGALRASIRIVERRGTPTRVAFQVMAGGMTGAQQKKWGMNSAFYSLWVERGHINRRMGQALRGPKVLQQHYRSISISNTPAHPYLAPAVVTEADAVIGSISEAISQQLGAL